MMPKIFGRDVASVRVVTAKSASDLNNRIAPLIDQGWRPLGPHSVAVKRVQNRFSGSVHMDSVNELEYSITLKLDR